MATVGTKLTIPFTVGTGQIVGQGNSPEAWILYSTDDVSDADPTWLDATAKVRSFSTSRGRENELSEVDAGTATLALDNRTRTFDPVINASIRPLNRWWIREQFTGETQDIFKGYAESYDQVWPNGMDAEAVVQCADEFKMLARDRLPAMNPPGEDYKSVVLSDKPSDYWRFDDRFVYTIEGRNKRGQSYPITVTEDAAAEVGSALGPGYGSPFTLEEVATPLVGDRGKAARLKDEVIFAVTPITRGQNGDVIGLTEFSMELWFRTDGAPSVNRSLVAGPFSTGGNSTYQLLQNTAGGLDLTARNDGGTLHTISSGVLNLNAWYHVVGTIESTTLRLYLNAVQVASTAWTGGGFSANFAANEIFKIGSSSGITPTNDYDEVAIYRHGLTAARISAHYEAGVSRGFADGHPPGPRLGAILDAVGSQAPRQIQAGVRTMTGVYMHGQSPLGEAKDCAKAESVDALLFTARDGTLTFLAAAHRSASPYNTVQATFDDDGTDLPYLDISQMPYSDADVANQWSVTAKDGLSQTVEDAASVAAYGPAPKALMDVPVNTDAQALTIATAMLAKYKDPFHRITGLALDTNVAAVTEAVFRLDIGDRIRVLRTPPGGGARIDQTLFVQKVEVAAANDGKPWSIALGVSPL